MKPGATPREGTKKSKTARHETRRLNFTDRGIRALPPGDGQPIDYSDTVQRGLRLRVSPSGDRTFLLAYRRPRDGAGVKLSIGSLSERMTLTQARREAADALALLRREPPIDPAEERAKRRAAALAQAEALRFSKVCEAFVEEELPGFRPATRRGWMRFIEKEILPALGHLRPEDVTAGHLAELRGTIERGRQGPKAKDGSPTWTRKPAPVSAQRCFEVVRRIFAWATTADPDVVLARSRHGISQLGLNPADAARSFRRRHGNRRTRAVSAAKAFTDAQLRAIFAAAEVECTKAAAQKAGRSKGKPPTGPDAHEIEARAFANLLALVAHTAVRAHDARAARWPDIDEGRKVWTISRHKTSDLTGTPHVVPLSSGALQILTRIKEANLAAGHRGAEWLFPAPDVSSCEVCGEAGHSDKDAKASARVKKAGLFQNS
jgi:integrase